jgi:hypothetical protein
MDKINKAKQKFMEGMLKEADLSTLSSRLATSPVYKKQATHIKATQSSRDGRDIERGGRVVPPIERRFGTVMKRKYAAGEYHPSGKGYK